MRACGRPSADYPQLSNASRESDRVCPQSTLREAFAAAVAFYPARSACRAWTNASIPVLFFYGDLDNWTPPGQCVKPVNSVNNRGRMSHGKSIRARITGSMFSERRDESIGEVTSSSTMLKRLLTPGAGPSFSWIGIYGKSNSLCRRQQGSSTSIAFPGHDGEDICYSAQTAAKGLRILSCRSMTCPWKSSEYKVLHPAQSAEATIVAS